MNKANRKKDLEAYHKKCGDGKAKLSNSQMKNRLNRFLGNEESKISSLALTKSFKSVSIPENNEGIVDNIHPEILSNLNNFPKDPFDRVGNHRILDINILMDGTLSINGIVMDGKENSPAERGVYSVLSLNDVRQQKLEQKLFEEGKLKEVSDRTMKLHKEAGILDALLDDPDVDTEPDRPDQY